ncbi:MAG: ferredoxin [SAR324 cluster bacterium]|uniref:Ferredoxin n=1 Tax=SAR324 cluster bacterium TaxID=2024889 RepID=A0A2A4T1T3_9DELT|nr:MAG: ferredoxin [SAR324 cluster bacterium]
MSLLTHHFFVCVNDRPAGHPKGSCVEKGAAAIVDAMRRKVEEKNLWGKVQVTGTGCLGPCQAGPVVVVYPEGIWYRVPTPADVDEIFEQHVGQGKPVERLQFDPERM